MPTPQISQTKDNYNKEQTKVLAARLRDLLEEAALIEQQRSVEGESKEPNPSLIAAENFIKNLDKMIEDLSDGFQLSKSDILSADFDQCSILRSAIRHRFNAILSLLIKHSVNLKAQGNERLSKTVIAAEELNYHAFKTLYETPSLITSDLKEGEILLVLALDQDPRSIEMEIKEQEAIARYLIEEAKIDLNFVQLKKHKAENKECLYYAAVVAQSPVIVEMILQYAPNKPFDQVPYNQYHVLIACLTYFKPEFGERLSRIVSSLLNHFKFTQIGFTNALLLAIEMDCITSAPHIIKDLKDKGAVVTLEILNIALERHVNSIITGKNENASLAKVRAIFKAGGKINAVPEIGSSILKCITQAQYSNWVNGNPKPDQAKYDLLLLLGEQGTTFSHEQLVEHLHSIVYSCCKDFRKALFKFFISSGVSLAEGLFDRNKSLLHRLYSYSEPTELTELCKEKIKLLSQEDKDKLLLEFFVEIRNTDPQSFCNTIRLALIEAGANINQFDHAGRSLIFWAVYDRVVNIVQAMCNLPMILDVLNKDNNFYYNKEKFERISYNVQYYSGYYYDGSHYSYPWPCFDNIILMAIPSLEMIEALCKAGFKISKATLLDFQDFIKAQFPEEQVYEPVYKIINSHISMLKVVHTLRKKNKNTAEEVGCELESKTSDPDNILRNKIQSQLDTESPDAIKKLLENNLNKLELDTLTMTFNRLFELDMSLQLEDKAHGFKHAKELMCILDDAGYDYMQILAHPENLPLRYVLSIPSQEHDPEKQRKLAACSMRAMKLLLQFAPFTQLACLEEDKDRFKKLKKSLFKECRALLEEEFDKSKADCVDYAFYIKERATSNKNPKDLAKRCSSFTTIIEKLDKIKSEFDLINLHVTVLAAIKKSTKIGKRGKSAKILEGILHSIEEDTPIPIPIKDFKTFRFFTENRAYILKVKEEIAPMFPSNNPNKK